MTLLEELKDVKGMRKELNELISEIDLKKKEEWTYVKEASSKKASFYNGAQ